jgi:hypothetical protein
MHENAATIFACEDPCPQRGAAQYEAVAPGGNSVRKLNTSRNEEMSEQLPQPPIPGANETVFRNVSFFVSEAEELH